MLLCCAINTLDLRIKCFFYLISKILISIIWLFVFNCSFSIVWCSCHLNKRLVLIRFFLLIYMFLYPIYPFHSLLPSRIPMLRYFAKIFLELLTRKVRHNNFVPFYNIKMFWSFETVYNFEIYTISLYLL